MISFLVMSEQFTEYTLPDKAYAAFDAESLKSLITQRLTEQGTFTDQIYEGSNISSFIDVIAYSYHVLLFYLNRTSSESVFTEATIYENVNRIVKLLNYNPLGFQTSTLTFKAIASEDLVPGSYTIPRYTYVNSNGVTYSTNTDISFVKSTINNETLNVVGDSHLLYQGEWIEYDPIAALGTNFETITITPKNKENHVDHFNVHVYVKQTIDGVSKYFQFEETSSLYLHENNDRVFEKRLNEDLSYEIKFGNNVNGSRLQSGDEIQVYYLESIGDDGRVGASFLDRTKLVMYGTTTFNNIKNDITSINTNYITFDNLETVSMSNETPSTYSQTRETISDIKRKAPIHFTSQNRLVTLNDYLSFVDRNFDRIISSSTVVDNNTYMDGHYKYMLETIGINNPATESRIMFNHLDFASSSTGNNVYIYAVPRVAQNTSTLPMTSFLKPSQKSLILNSLSSRVMVSHQPIVMDPVYMAVNIATSTSTEQPDVSMINNTQLHVKRSAGISRDDASIIGDILNVIGRYFDSTSASLGQVVDVVHVGQQILDIQGVDEIHTVRTDTNQKTLGMSLCVWNPVYEDLDVEITTQNIILPYFKYPYFHDLYSLKDKIVLID